MKGLLLIFCSFLLFTASAQQLKQNQTSQAGQLLENGGVKTTIVAHQYSVQALNNSNVKHAAGMLSNRIVSNVADSLALVDLYLATNPNDTTWINSDGWLTGPLASWYGVGLDASGRVNYLDLSNNNLSGELPQSLSGLDSLEYFFFYVNPSLSGDLFSILRNYSKLLRVSAHDCAFSGIIDPAIFRPGLLEIRVFNNSFTGGIPDEIGLATDMEQFNISGNQISDSIPTTIGNAIRLKHLELSRNDIYGVVPQEIGNIDSLQYLIMEQTALTGDFPESILNCTQLREVWLVQNDFTGVFPNVLSLPNIHFIRLGGNRRLLFDIPDNIGDYTNLTYLSIWNTVPNAGEFPAGFYQLTNLVGLDLSDQRFTGTLDEAIGGLTNLESFSIRNNNLTSEVPTAIANLVNLITLDLRGNLFSSLPDLTGLSNLQNLFLRNNYFQIAAMQPYAQKGLSTFDYAPQRRIGTNQELQPTVGSSFNITPEIDDFSGTIYQWFFNNDSLQAGTSRVLNIANFNNSKAGAYVLQARHPDLPNLVLVSAFINVKANSNTSKWFVDNNMNHTADFRSVYQAVAATQEGDTIYVAGSAIAYGRVDLFSNRVLLGPGYYLGENTNTQFNKVSAKVPYINITKDASGAQIYGMDVDEINLNDQGSSLPDTLKNVIIKGNKVQLLSVADKNFEIELAGNDITNLQFNATTALNVIRSYDNFNIHNNIIDTVSTFFRDINAVNNGLTNIVFDFNTIGYITDSINDVVFNNNIIDVNLSGNSVNIGNISYADANFINASGSLSIDNDFLTQDANLNKGAFGGSEPYILSGLPPIPAIYDVVIGSSLSLLVKAKTQDAVAINTLKYLYRKDNTNSSSFSVRGFTSNQDISVEFLPNRSAISANQSYEVVMVAIDAAGKRSHRAYIPYEAIAANLSGTVVDIEGVSVNTGDVKLFAVNSFANKYDTAAIQQLAGANTFNFENLILGDYIILANPSKTDYPNLIPTYLGNTIDWQLAATLSLVQNISAIKIEVEKRPAPSTEAQVGFVSGFFEEEYEDADSSLRQLLPRQRLSGSGVSVRRLGNSNKSSLRLIQEDMELVAYTTTDENGEYEMPNLPEGEYAIRFEYPGVETDETSDVFFTIEEGVSESIQVDAKVEDGKIVITNNSVVVANGELNELTIKLFPNPANAYLNIGMSYIEGDIMLKMIDLKGRIVRESIISKTDSRIFIGDLEHGLYLIHLTDDKNIALKLKIIKK